MNLSNTMAMLIVAVDEETELEGLVEVLGDQEAQITAHCHVLPALVAEAQAHG